MTLSLQPERSELLQPSVGGGSGLNTEFSSLMQGTQKAQADKPQVVSADGTQLVIPPLGQTTTTGDQTAGPTATPTKAGATADAAKTPAPEQLPQSVAYNPSLSVPTWQRFSQTAVATDGSIMPVMGPGSPGDPGPGPMMPMWMRLAQPGIQALLDKQQQAEARPSTTATASTDQSGQAQTATTDGSDPNATASTDQTKVAQVPTDANASNSAKQLPGGQTGPLVT